jgi:hypothetical protein
MTFNEYRFPEGVLYLLPVSYPDYSGNRQAIFNSGYQKRVVSNNGKVPFIQLQDMIP